MKQTNSAHIDVAVRAYLNVEVKVHSMSLGGGHSLTTAVA